MRASLPTGIILLVLGIVFCYLAQGIMGAPALTQDQMISITVAFVFYLLSSATLLGIGGALVVHWLASFGKPFTAFGFEMVLSFAVFVAGIIGAIISTHWSSGLHIVLACFTASSMLLILSFISFFGGVMQGIKSCTKEIKKKMPQFFSKKKRK